MLGRPRRVAILAEGAFIDLEAKTAIGVLRYRPDEVAVVIDSQRFGRTAESCVGAGGAVPVVADLDQAAACGADSLLIGIAPQGGALPEAWRPIVGGALARGWDVLSGLHLFIGDDPEFARLAAERGAVIHDVRRPPPDLPVATARAADVGALVALTVGSDCAVGKMTAAYEIVSAIERRGRRASFVATGQTGIFIADHGIAVDALPADFVSGGIERLVVEAARDADIVVVEGQGSLHHPSYSAVTLGILHGACPGAMVLCHVPSRLRLHVSGHPDGGPPMPGLAAVRRAYEDAARWVRPSQMVGVALNTWGLDAAAAQAACADAAEQLKLPATDPVRFGADALADALIALWEDMRGARTPSTSR